MSLKTKLDELPKRGGYYACLCGEQGLRRDTVLKHVQKRKHTERLAKLEFVRECFICYENQVDFFSCVVCGAEHCRGCHSKIVKCPFCNYEWDGTVTNL